MVKISVSTQKIIKCKYLRQCNRKIIWCESTTRKATSRLLNPSRRDAIYRWISWCKCTWHVGNIKAAMDIMQSLNSPCRKNLAIIQLNERIKLIHSSKISPPVWWKTGEAAPDWPENDVAKDRPVPSGRFEADPFREDCKQNSITIYLYW